MSEPIQFYTGRDRLLYELVVWSIDKKKATGYLSTPKNAPGANDAGSTERASRHEIRPGKDWGNIFGFIS